MPFEKGKPKTGGRAKGVPNNTTQSIRENISLIVANNMARLQEDLDMMRPADRVKAIIDISKYVVPTLKSVEYEDKTEREIVPINITFSKKTK